MRALTGLKSVACRLEPFRLWSKTKGGAVMQRIGHDPVCPDISLQSIAASFGLGVLGGHRRIVTSGDYAREACRPPCPPLRDNERNARAFFVGLCRVVAIRSCAWRLSSICACAYVSIVIFALA